MILDRMQFEELFPKNLDLWYTMTTQPKDYEELITKYLPSKLWRMNNLYSIIDKIGDRVPFHMNYAQFKIHATSLKHPRLIILKSRQQGISTFWLISFFDDLITLGNLECGLMAQGSDEAKKLLDRLKHTWDTLEPWVKEFFSLKIVKNNASEFRLSNNSSMFVRTSFRSATLQRLHISELGKIANKFPERAKETKTGTLQALAPGNTGIIESTAEGVNMFKYMWDQSVKTYGSDRLAGKDFMPVFLSWIDDPDCVEWEEQYPDDDELEYFARLEEELKVTLSKEQRNFWVAQHRELEGDIHQEYPATPQEAFTAAMDGTYWAKRYLKMIVRRRRRLPYEELYDPNLDVYLTLDAGRNDYMVLVFFQVWRGQVRILAEYYNSGEWLGHYVDYVAEICEETGWNVVHWYLPHDMGVVDLTQDENKTREQILNDLGVGNTTILDKLSKLHGIEEVREAFSYIWMADECVYLEQCCLNYTKTWNPLLEVWRNEPKRNQWAHGADAIRYLVQTCTVHIFDHEDNDDYIVDTGGIAI
jgi:hypothetical protein